MLRSPSLGRRHSKHLRRALLDRTAILNWNPALASEMGELAGAREYPEPLAIAPRPAILSQDSMPRRHAARSALRQKQLAILEAPKGTQQRVVGLALGLRLLGLAEARLRLGPAARLCRASAWSARLVIRSYASPLRSARVTDCSAFPTASTSPPSVSSNSLRLPALMDASFQSFARTRISSPARTGSRASVSRPKARSRKPASFSSRAWSASVIAGETRLHGVSKKQARAPKSEPNAPSFFEL